MINVTYHVPAEEHTYVNDLTEEDYAQHMLKIHETRLVSTYSLDGEGLREFAIAELEELIETIKALDMPTMVGKLRK